MVASRAKRATEADSPNRPPRHLIKLGTASTFKFKRTWQQQLPIVPTDVNPYLGGGVTTLSTLPGFSDFTNLFDQYRILAMRITFQRPYHQTGTMPLAANASQTNLPAIWFHSAVDFDDATTPSNIQQLQEYPSYRCVELTGAGNQFTLAFQPRVAMAVYGSGVFTSFGNASPWIDAASVNVPYYGYKYALEARYADGLPITFGVNTDITIQCECWMEFRNPR